MARIYTETVPNTDTSILRVVGKVTIGSGDVALRQAVTDTLNSGRRDLILDLAEVTTIDSSGIGELVSSYTMTVNRGGSLVTSRLPAKLNELLHVTQLITVFDVYESSFDAVAAIRERRGVRTTGETQAILENLSFRADVLPSGIVIPRLVDSTQLLADHLLREPESVYKLPPRRFEELIAELVKQFGWRVHLTPATHDGGRDIVALIPSPVGDLMCLIEAKRFREDRKVGVGLVRQLWGTVNHEDASIGLLVTSSSFSSEARAFEKQHETRLKLRDNDDVFDWLHVYSREGGWRRTL